jgi:hypothetical protein
MSEATPAQAAAKEAGLDPATAITVEIPSNAPAKKVFNPRNGGFPAFVPISLALPFIFEDYEPWTFKLRYKLSADAEKRRQKHATLAPAKKAEMIDERNLDELCDLLVELPTGFDGLKEVQGQKPGDTFMNYVKTISDPNGKAIVMQVVGGALDHYWGKLMPQEFRPTV